MITSRTAARSSFESANRLRIRMPHSSAVCSWMVRRRQRPAMSSPSKAPMVTFELPTSRARSILNWSYATCKDSGFRSIIFAHPQEACRIEPAGDAFQARDACIHSHSLSGDVAGSIREPPQNLIGAQPGIAIYEFDQRDQQVFAGDLNTFQKQRRGGRFE